MALIAALLAIGSLASAAVPAGASTPGPTKSAAYAATHSSGHYQQGVGRQGGGNGSGKATGRFRATLLSRPPALSPAQRALQNAVLHRTRTVRPQTRSAAGQAPLIRVHPTVAHAAILGASATNKSAAQAPTDFNTFRGTDMTGVTSSGSSGVGEPSTANDGNVVLYTGNWYAALSTDSGHSFSFINPYTLGPASSLPNGGFCCDQSAIHAPAVGGTDVTAWALLYCQVSNNCSSGDNILRLAVARNQADLASASFDYYDFSAQSFGFPEGYNLDYPHLAANDGYLSMSINVFDNNGNFYTSMLVHFSESALANGGDSYSYYWNAQDFTWTPTDNSHDSWTYWAATAWGNNSLIRVYYWPPGTPYTSVGWNDFSVGFNYSTQSSSCPAPDGNNWCAFDDSRVKTGGEIGTSTAWFMWDAAQGNGAPNPYVEYASFNVSSGPATSMSPGYFAYNNTAVAYPGLGVDNAGNMALSVEFGGSSWGYPQTILGIDDDVTGGGFAWYAYNKSSASNTRWGDYLTARAAETPSGTENSWIATGYSLDASGNAHPAFYWIGRNRDDPFAPSWYYSYAPSYTEGASADNYSGIFYGPSNCTCDYFGLMYWGDGNSNYTDLWNYSTDHFLMHLPYTYAEEGTFTQTMYGEDIFGNSASGTATASVADAPLHATGVTFSATKGSTFNGVVAKFSDADPHGIVADYSAAINWGDGTTSAGTIAGAFTVSGSHVYSSAGSRTVSVSIGDAGGATTSATSTAHVIAARPVISSVSANAGPLAGGNTVTITGSYLTGTTSVKFGATAATSFTVVSASKITAKVPAHAAGLVDVHVMTPGGTSLAASADHYTYVAAPAVTKVSPTSGSHLGATTVTVTGTNFTFVSKVLFGTTPGTSVHVISATQLTVRSPAHAAGTVNIQVTNAGGTSPSVPADTYKFI